MTELDLDALQAMADMASPGPWRVTQDHLDRPIQFDVVDASDAWVVVDSDGYEGAIPEAPDAAFIAVAREAVPALIARVRELEASEELLLSESESMLAENYDLSVKCGESE